MAGRSPLFLAARVKAAESLAADQNRWGRGCAAPSQGGLLGAWETAARRRGRAWARGVASQPHAHWARNPPGGRQDCGAEQISSDHDDNLADATAGSAPCDTTAGGWRVLCRPGSQPWPPWTWRRPLPCIHDDVVFAACMCGKRQPLASVVGGLREACTSSGHTSAGARCPTSETFQTSGVDMPGPGPDVFELALAHVALRHPTPFLERGRMNIPRSNCSSRVSMHNQNAGIPPPPHTHHDFHSQ